MRTVHTPSALATHCACFVNSLFPNSYNSWTHSDALGIFVLFLCNARTVRRVGVTGSLKIVQRLRITFSSDCAFCDKSTKIGTLVVFYI